MSAQSRRVAGALLIILPTVVFGGVSILTLLINDPAYQENALRQDLWRAGHAHAGVLLLLSLIALRYVDEATLGERARSFVRYGFPAAALLLPLAFFLSVLSPQATPAQRADLAGLRRGRGADRGAADPRRRADPIQPRPARQAPRQGQRPVTSAPGGARAGRAPGGRPRDGRARGPCGRDAAGQGHRRGRQQADEA